MTVSEFNNKLLCYYCNFAEKVKQYTNKLRFGIWCSEEEDEVIEAYLLIEQFEMYDTRDLPDFEEIYDFYSKEDIENLMQKIESLI